MKPITTLLSSDPITISTIIKIATLSFVSLSLLFLGKLFSDSYQKFPAFSAPINTAAVSANRTPPTPTPAARPPPPPLGVERTGIVDENGIMTGDFVVGEFDSSIIESVASSSARESDDDAMNRTRVRVGKFRICGEKLMEYIPCLDNVEAISKLNSTSRGENYERYCPEKGKELNCLVPRPKGYKLKIPWPQSRNKVN